MKKWITNAYLCHMDTVIDYDDIIFYPHELYEPKMLKDEIRLCYRNGVLQSIFGKDHLLEWQEEAECSGTAHHCVFGTNTRALSIIQKLRGMYRESMYAKQIEPNWIRQLPKKIRGDIRRYWHVIDHEDPECIVPFMPFTDLRYLVREDGVCTDTIRACRLYRLGRIRQLGNLHDPSVYEAGFVSMGQRFNHTRYLHVHDASALITLMGFNNGIEHRLLTHLRVAALIHDALTPAHGDGTKAIDMIRFDEDAFVATLLEGHDWELLKKKHGLSKTLLVDLVQHRHILGTLLDYADRIAYTSRDLDAYLSRYWNNQRIATTREYRELSDIVKKNPHVCSLWDTIHVGLDDLV